MFEDFNGIPFPQFFGAKEAYKTVSIWDRLGYGFKTFGSLLWASSGYNTITVLLESFSGLYDDLGFLDKLLWITYRLGTNAYIGSLNYDALVFGRNFEFVLFKQLAATAAALWFRFFFLWNLFLWFTADGLFEADWEDLDERNLDYSLTQATAYHYWEDKEAHGLFTMLWTNYVTDSLQLFFGLPSLIVAAPAYGIFKLANILLFPLILTIKVITPWSENQGETWVMWWVDAVKLGLYDPMDPPTNFFEIEDARTQYLSRFDDVERDPEDEPEE